MRSPFFYFGLALFFATLFFCLKGVVVADSAKQSGQPAVSLENSNYIFAQQKAVSTRPSFAISGGCVIEPMSPPFLVDSRTLGSIGDEMVDVSDNGFSGSQKEITRYLVQDGDTLAGIAEQAGISLNTLLWANNLTSKSKLKTGQEIIVLSVSGVMHIVKNGETISSLAKLYKASGAEIIEFNELGDEGDIFIGDILVIPGGVKPKVVPVASSVAVPNSYFIIPLPTPCRVTQGLHWFNAVDLAAGGCGQPVFATAGGEVQRVGFDSVGGNYVQLVHNNGVVTYYGHLSKFTVCQGQKVSQGEIIGYVGYSGKTIPAGPAGCHLHFDVRFSANPFAGYAVGTKISK